MKTLIKVKTKQNIFKLLVLWFIMFFGTIATILLEQEDGKVVPIIALVILIVAGITTCLKSKIFATVIAAIFVLLTFIEFCLNVGYVDDELYVLAIIILPIIGVIFAISINVKGEIEVTDKCVRYEGLVRKNIPIGKVCCVERRMFREIVIHASSGKIYGYMVDNVDELYTVLNNLINEPDSIYSVGEEN